MLLLVLLVGAATIAIFGRRTNALSLEDIGEQTLGQAKARS
jgi:hypothetical protein